MGHKKSYWQKAKRGGWGVFVLSIIHAYLIIWSSIQHNRDQEYCTFVKEGAPFQFITDDMPCFVTNENLVNMALTFILAVVVYQVFYWIFASTIGVLLKTQREKCK